MKAKCLHVILLALIFASTSVLTITQDKSDEDLLKELDDALEESDIFGEIALLGKTPRVSGCMRTTLTAPSIKTYMLWLADIYQGRCG